MCGNIKCMIMMSLSINLWNSWPLWHGPGPRAGPISILSYGKFKFYNISICTSVLSSLGTKVKCVLFYPKCPLQIHVIMSFISFFEGGGANMVPEVTRVPVVVGHALHVDNFTLGYATHMTVKACGLLVL